jgi:hypothetical protein
MDISKYRKPRLLSKEDCPIKLTITDTALEPSKYSDTGKGIKIYLGSEIGEKFSFWLNDINLNVIANKHGNEADNWRDTEWEFVHDPALEYEGRGGVRIVPIRKKSTLKPKTPPEKPNEDKNPY